MGHAFNGLELIVFGMEYKKIARIYHRGCRLVVRYLDSMLWMSESHKFPCLKLIPGGVCDGRLRGGCGGDKGQPY